MVDIIHRIGIEAPPARVFAALATTAGVAGWWTEEVGGESEVGRRIMVTFRAPGGGVMGQMEMTVRELAAPTRVAWRCSAGPEEWVGTDITFDLSFQNGRTIVIFGHRNWREAIEFTAHCSMKWAVFLLSLRDLVETGKGRPSPRDMKIDDWN